MKTLAVSLTETGDEASALQTTSSYQNSGLEISNACAGSGVCQQAPERARTVHIKQAVAAMATW
jgi:hypothetical protein